MMLTEPTIEKLNFMRLAAMASAWLGQQKDPKLGALSFDERFGMIVDAEYAARDNRRLARLLKMALRIPNACIEDVRVSPARLDKAMSGSSRRADHIPERAVTGPPASARLPRLGARTGCLPQACVLYRRVPASSTSSSSRAEACTPPSPASLPTS
jgi:hypothetical protein